MKAYSAFPLPAPQPGCLIPLFAAGKAEPDLEHQADPGWIGDRCRPRALPARLERLANPQRPPASEAVDDLWKIGNPVAYVFVAPRGLGQVPRHNEGCHSKTLPAGWWRRQTS